MNDEATDRDEDAGIGHIEGRKRMREWHVQIKECEIDDVAVNEAVRQVPHDPAEQQRE